MTHQAQVSVGRPEKGIAFLQFSIVSETAISPEILPSFSPFSFLRRESIDHFLHDISRDGGLPLKTNCDCTLT